MLSLLSICGFVGCIMPAMASSGQGSERLNAQLLVDSIPALIHTARPDGYLDYFNKPWLEYLGVALDKLTGWNWTAVVHPEDVEGIVAKWRACLATGNAGQTYHASTYWSCWFLGFALIANGQPDERTARVQTAGTQN
jgi:PAS domain-containing protein